MSPKLKPLLLSLIMFALSGCVHSSTDPVVLSDYCRIAAPIGYDGGKDTPETVKEIEAHNSKWACVCEKDCPGGL